jgi:hypothetical protein
LRPLNFGRLLDGRFFHGRRLVQHLRLDHTEAIFLGWGRIIDRRGQIRTRNRLCYTDKETERRDVSGQGVRGSSRGLINGTKEIVI